MFKRLHFTGTRPFIHKEAGLTEVFVLLSGVCRQDVSLERSKGVLEVLFRYLGLSIEYRNLTFEGFFKFKGLFPKFAVNYYRIDNMDDYLLFRDEFIDFLNECFPIMEDI